jgi:hypothetical protein
MLDRLSIVIAAKSPPVEQFRLCLASFAALANASKLQVIVVKSGELPELPASLIAGFAEFKLVDVPPEGVYAAYNAGCDHALGSYTLFFGADDIALPAMDSLMEQMLFHDDTYTLVAAPCFMQSSGLAKPSRRRSSLIFANWCHQGLFYRTSYLKENRYQGHLYSIQADHKMNIDIVSNRAYRFFVSDLVVAYFCAGGVSSVRPDLQFRADFPAIVGRAYGRHWGWLVRIRQIAIDLVKGPPERRFKSTFRR